jgi:hypothetical protein
MRGRLAAPRRLAPPTARTGCPRRRQRTTPPPFSDEGRLCLWGDQFRGGIRFGSSPNRLLARSTLS